MTGTRDRNVLGTAKDAVMAVRELRISDKTARFSVSYAYSIQTDRHG